MVDEKIDLRTPDLCAQLDTMKFLCDQLQAAQADATRARELVERIRLEVEALSNTVCALDQNALKEPKTRSA